jgi:coenzyme F420-reducing hydrogenase beta subunit
MARSAKFEVFCKLDSASVPQKGSVIVERSTNTVIVRRSRARSTWTFTLDAMIQMAVERAIKAEVLKKRLEKANAVKTKKREAREIRRIRSGR